MLTLNGTNIQYILLIVSTKQWIKPWPRKHSTIWIKSYSIRRNSSYIQRYFIQLTTYRKIPNKSIIHTTYYSCTFIMQIFDKFLFIYGIPNIWFSIQYRDKSLYTHTHRKILTLYWIFQAQSTLQAQSCPAYTLLSKY